MKTRITHFCAVLAAFLCAENLGADDKPNAAAKSAYRVLAQDKGHVAIVNAKGEVEWEVPCPYDSHDIAMLPGGNVLLHTGDATVVEMTPEKKIIWKYAAQPKEGYMGRIEIHSFQRLDDGRT